MKRWSKLTHEVEISPGDFLEARLQTLSGQAIHHEKALIRELAARSMLRYESLPSGSPLLLDLTAFLERPEKTRRFYRRLFDEAGAPTRDFLTWVSETLAIWMEESFEPLLLTEGGRPHDTEPGYDIISVVKDEDQLPRLRLVQVKATENRLQQNCGLALRKFRKLEAGKYDAELLSRLRLMEELGRVPVNVNPRELLNDPTRRYRVTAVHGEDRDALEILTLYAEVIPGEPTRRSSRFVHVEAWSAFWEEVAGEAYAQLS